MLFLWGPFFRFFFGGGAFLGARLTEGLETSSGGTFQCMGQAQVCTYSPFVCLGCWDRNSDWFASDRARDSGASTPVSKPRLQTAAESSSRHASPDGWPQSPPPSLLRRSPRTPHPRRACLGVEEERRRRRTRMFSTRHAHRHPARPASAPPRHPPHRHPRPWSRLVSSAGSP